MSRKRTILIIVTAVLLLFMGGLCVIVERTVGHGNERDAQCVGIKNVIVGKQLSSIALLPSGEHVLGTDGTSRIEFLSGRPGETRLRFRLGKVTVAKVKFNDESYSVVRAKECVQSGRAGEPELPVFGFDVAAGTGVECKIVECEWDEIEAPPPLPSAGPYWRSFGFEGERVADGRIYGGGKVHPSEVADIQSTYWIRGVSGAGVQISPVCYDFNRGVLRVAKSIDVVVRDGGDGTAQNLDANASFANIQSGMFVNARVFSSSRAALDANPIGRLLMVLPDAWSGVEDDFVSWKRIVGFDAEVCLYPSETGEGADALAEHIRKAYSESDITHVILCGDWDDVPPAYTSENTQSPGVKTPTSDVRYVFLSGDDCVADAFISRIPAHSSEQLKGVLAKMVSYEREPPDDDSWREKPLIMCSSERSSSGIYKNISDYVLMKEMYAGLVSAGVFLDDKSRLLCDSTSTSGNVLSVLNCDGASLFCYLGHGLYDSWVIGNKRRFSVSDATGMMNGMRLPFVLAPVCDSGNFANKNGDCLAEAFFLNGQYSENGAVAVLAATSQTLWNPPIKSIMEFAEQLKMAYSDGRAVSVGELFQRSVLSGIQLAASEPSSLVDSSSDYFACQIHLFGDCTMMPRIRTLRPALVETTLDANTLTVSVKWSDNGLPIKGAFVTVTSGEHDVVRRMVCDESGKAATNVCDLGGEVTLNVNDFSIRPYSSKIDVGASNALDADGDGFVANAELLAFLAHSEDCPECKAKVGEAIELWKSGGMQPAVTTDVVPTGRIIELNDTGINSYGNIMGEMDSLAAEHSELCRVEYIGQSEEGREIRSLCICAADEKDVPHLLVVGGCNQDERNSTQMALHFARTLIANKDIVSKAAFHLLPLLYPDEWEGAAVSDYGEVQERRAFLKWAECNEFVAAIVLNSGGASVFCPSGTLAEQANDFREFTILRNAWTENCDLLDDSFNEEKHSPLLDTLYKDLGILAIEVNVGEHSHLAGKKLQSLCASCEKAFAVWSKAAMTGFSLSIASGVFSNESVVPYSIRVDGQESRVLLSGGRRRFRTMASGKHELVAKSDGLVAQYNQFVVDELMTPLKLDVVMTDETPVQGIALMPKRFVPARDNTIKAEYSYYKNENMIWNVKFSGVWNGRADKADAFRIESDGSFSYLFMDAPASGNLNCVVHPFTEDDTDGNVVSTLLWNGNSSRGTFRWHGCERRTVGIQAEKGWNLVGSTLFAEIPSAFRAWRYDNGFHDCKAMEPACAYWLYSDEKSNVAITGWYSDYYAEASKAGWRLFTPMRHVRAQRKCLEYSRESRGYRTIGDVLIPGNAYWAFGE